MATDPELERVISRITDVGNDPDRTGTIILKGRLLVEEQLGHCLEWAVPGPQFLREANLRFHQKLLVARSLEASDNPAWELANLINGLRNEMAHDLAAPKRSKRIGELRAKLQTLHDQPDVATRSATAREEIVVAFAVGVCLGFLAAWQNGMRVDREAAAADS
jgi:hypothetical protein